MKRFLPVLMVSAACLTLAPLTLAAGTPDYSGVWDVRAYGDDGSQVTQSVTLFQTEKNGQVYLSGYDFTGAIKNGTGSVLKVTKYKEYVRTESGTLNISGRSMTGTGTVREVYYTGDIVVTKYRIVGSRRG